eukprot:COSAG02_NODE_49506_length_326_cov_0.916300_2_plen_44_part_01
MFGAMRTCLRRTRGFPINLSLDVEHRLVEPHPLGALATVRQSNS